MASKINVIGYSLLENKLRPAEGKKFFRAQINAKGRVNQEHLINMIVKRNSTVTRPEVTAVLDLLQEVVEESMQNGFNIHTN